MGNRWLYLVVSLFHATALCGRMYFALDGEAPWNFSRRIPGGAGGLYFANSVALILLVTAAVLLWRKAVGGLLLFVFGLVAYMWSNDIAYAAGSFPLLILLAAFALFAYNKESNSNGQRA
jgi:hypothetical protein